MLPVTSITNHPATHLLAMYTSTGWPCFSLVAVLAFDLRCLGFVICRLPLRRELQIRNRLRLRARERGKIIGPVEIATTKRASGEGRRPLGEDTETPASQAEALLVLGVRMPVATEQCEMCQAGVISFLSFLVALVLSFSLRKTIEVAFEVSRRDNS